MGQRWLSQYANKHLPGVHHAEAKVYVDMATIVLSKPLDASNVDYKTLAHAFGAPMKRLEVLLKNKVSALH